MATTSIPSVNDVDTMLTGQLREWERLREELRPAVEAFSRIEGMIANFNRISEPAAAPARGRGRSGPRQGTRGDEFVQLAARPDGVSVSEAAQAMDGIDPDRPTYLYSLAKRLTEGGQIRKDGKRYFAVEQAAATDETPAEEPAKDSN